MGAGHPKDRETLRKPDDKSGESQPFARCQTIVRYRYD